MTKQEILEQQELIKARTPEAIYWEQVGMGKALKRFEPYIEGGLMKHSDFTHCLYSAEDLQHIKHELMIAKTNLRVDEEVQRKGGDLLMWKIIVDVKNNGIFPLNRCAFEVYGLPDGRYRHWGLYNETDAVFHHMEYNDSWHWFNYRKIISLANDYHLPTWFNQKRYWEIKQHEPWKYDNKYLILAEPYTLAKVLLAMDCGYNPEGLELPTPKYEMKNGICLPA